jgi:alpha-glucoside transport system permease protein
VERLAALAVAVIGVPLVLAGYIVASEWLVGRLPVRRRASVRPWLWVAPALLLVTAFLVYPALATFWLSLHDARSERFVGLANYLDIAALEDMRIAVRNNALWVIFFTGAVLGFGLLFAVLADRVRYEGTAKSLVFLPMAISFVAAGVIWKFIYSFQPTGLPQTGLLNAAVTGLTASEPQAWLISALWNNFALIAVGVWVWTGFAMVILSAALKGVPTELLEAARVDGARELTVFRRIILPLLGPTIAVIATTLVIFALKAFDVVYVMTSGNFETEVIANLMYEQLFTVRHAGRASAIAVVLLLAIIPVLVINIRRFRFQEAVR